MIIDINSTLFYDLDDHTKWKFLIHFSTRFYEYPFQEGNLLL